MKTYTLLLIYVIISVVSCTQPEKKETPKKERTFTVERAPEWTDIFKRTSGWFGGDGIYAIPYSGVEAQSQQRNDSVLFVFSDTVIGEIVDGKLQPGYVMVSNSAAMCAGNDPSTMKFKVAKDAKGYANVFTPRSKNAQDGDFYWLGDGFVNHALDSNIYLLGFRMRWTNDGAKFPFKSVGNSLIVIDRKDPFPFRKLREIEIPFVRQESAKEEAENDTYGAAVLVNTKEAQAPDADGYIYIYGVHGINKSLVVSRVHPASFENFPTWKFWDGKDWSADPAQASSLMDSVSNEMSVVAIGDGQYAFVYQSGGIMPEIYMQIADSPVGPFESRKEIWNTKNDIQDPELITYNAKAHPAISKPGELLVSYTVNAFDFDKAIYKKPDLYRPRFVKIIFDKK